MSLRRVELEMPPCRLPAHLRVLLEEASPELSAWQGVGERRGFVPADYVLVYDALCALRRERPGPPGVFLEWGSGLGVVTMLAAALGWKASGIEIQPALLRESERLARVFGLSVRFRLGSFLPGEPRSVPRLADLCAEAGLVYVYPWPDHELEMFDLFDRVARPGARLLAYLGLEDVRVFEKCGGA